MRNRLIIIGNGFDLECGLKTRFESFFTSRFGSGSANRPNPDEMNLWDYIFQFMKEAKDDIPYDWKDVEAAIKDWIRVIFDASDDVSSKDDSPFTSAQWVIGRMLAGKTSTLYFIEAVLRSEKFLISDNVEDKLSSSQYSKPEYLSDGVIVLRAFEEYESTLGSILKAIKKYINSLKHIGTIDNFLFDELHKFENSFVNYINNELSQTYYENAVKLYEIISDFDIRLALIGGENNDYVLSFNYTRPGAADSDIHSCCWRNVHGSLKDRNVIFGFDIEDLPYEQRKDPRLLRFTKTYRVFQLPKGQEGQHSGLLDPVARGEAFDAIIVYGHSLSRADYSNFKAIFDCVDLYSSNVTLEFLYPSDYPQAGSRLYKAVSDLLTDYGDEMPDKARGRNLMHKLLLENRLSVAGIDTSSLVKNKAS